MAHSQLLFRNAHYHGYCWVVSVAGTRIASPCMLIKLPHRNNFDTISYSRTVENELACRAEWDGTGPAHAASDWKCGVVCCINVANAFRPPNATAHRTQRALAPRVFATHTLLIFWRSHFKHPLFPPCRPPLPWWCIYAGDECKLPQLRGVCARRQ